MSHILVQIEKIRRSCGPSLQAEIDENMDKM